MIKQPTTMEAMSPDPVPVRTVRKSFVRTHPGGGWKMFEIRDRPKVVEKALLIGAYFERNRLSNPPRPVRALHRS